MSWQKRDCRIISSKQLESLLNAALTKVWLKNDLNPTCAGPMEFKNLYGFGVRSEFTINSKNDLVKLRQWLSDSNDLVLGYFSYDLKNILESLESVNKDRIGFPKAYFFVPEIVVVEGLVGDLQCWSHQEIINIPTGKKNLVKRPGNSMQTIDKAVYMDCIRSLLRHIRLGDIYEVNYCIEHCLTQMVIDPIHTFKHLQEISPAPFSCYVEHDGKYLLSSSPERFMSKNGSRLVSQPMKGTNRRSADNGAQKERLKNDLKERAENIMITDLVRNDLSKSAKPETVVVEELCGVYEFEHVNQMISTVSCELRDDMHPLDALLNAFPMGSMTGAPKIRAMELIDQHEDFSRGLYSGAVGYFTPDLDFDFNVVIRSILYNESEQVVTFPTGGAITVNSDPKAEFEECMLKAEAMRKVLLGNES